MLARLELQPQPGPGGLKPDKKEEGAPRSRLALSRLSMSSQSFDTARFAPARAETTHNSRISALRASAQPQDRYIEHHNMSSDLLHEALRRATLRDRDNARSPQLSPPMGSSASAGSSDAGQDNDSDDDNTYTPVHTRPGTPTGTLARRTHRDRDASAWAATSSASTPAGSRSTSPSRIAKKKQAEEAERKASRDPLRRFDNEISSLIFRELDVIALARCLRVSKRWRRSATINWAWYLRFQERREDTTLRREPVWTRKESKEDWSRRYRSAFSLNGLQYKTAFEMDYEKARSDGYRTPKEEREAQWADEASSQNASSSNLNTMFGGDKLAARDYYKSLGGRTKMKGKGGSGVTGPRDRTAFGEDDY